jgi:hypothetical protein
VRLAFDRPRVRAGRIGRAPAREVMSAASRPRAPGASIPPGTARTPGWGPNLSEQPWTP